MLGTESWERFYLGGIEQKCLNLSGAEKWQHMHQKTKLLVRWCSVFSKKQARTEVCRWSWDLPRSQEHRADTPLLQWNLKPIFESPFVLRMFGTWKILDNEWILAVQGVSIVVGCQQIRSTKLRFQRVGTATIRPQLEPSQLNLGLAISVLLVASRGAAHA